MIHRTTFTIGLSLIILGVLSSALSVVACAQTTSTAQAEQIAKLDFLLGEWKGKGWTFRLDGSRGA